MAKISSDVLRKDIIDILKDADLTTMSSKKVRLQLSEKYGCDLQSRKEEIDQMIMELISQGPSNAASKAAPSTSSKPTTVKAANGRNEQSAVNDDSDESDVSDDEMNSKQSDSDDYELDDELLARKLQEEESANLRKRTRNPSKLPMQSRKKSTQSRKKSEKSKKSEKLKDGTKPKRITVFNEPLTLSPELAAIMGESQMPRHAVVKRMWEIVKERNLVDPKNRQFMICDDQLMTVFGKRKVRAFGMLKYLCEHMSSPNRASKRRK